MRARPGDMGVELHEMLQRKASEVDSKHFRDT